MVLAVDTALASHGLLLVLDVVHDDIAIVVEDVMAFIFGVDFKAFQFHLGMNFGHFFI